MRKIAIVGATPEAFIQLSLLINNRRYDGKEKYGDDEFTLIPVSYTHLTLPTKRIV